MSSAATLTYEYQIPEPPLRARGRRVRSRSILDTDADRSEIDSTTNTYDGIVLDSAFKNHFAKLDAIRTDSSLWPEHAERPSAVAHYLARVVLTRLYCEHFPPLRVVASAEGGIAVCFVQGKKYSDIECLNDGTILGVISNRKERPTVWEIVADSAEIAGACARVRKFFDS